MNTSLMVQKSQKIPQEIMTIREFDLSYNIKEGVCKINVHNSLVHESAKLKLMYLLMKAGKRVYSEVIFIGKKGRADIVNSTDGTILEILHSEKIEDAKKKESYYPSSLFIHYLTAEEILKSDFNI